LDRRAGLPYWPGLDGLRGLAVAAVLAFHGGLGWARGGFLGVSLFFTLSGFLITSLVVREREATGGVSLSAFWARRARRLLPASLAALVLAFAVAVVALPVAQQRPAVVDIRWAALNLANWRFLWRGDVYADITTLPSPVQHYWSLAIEEQFYVLFPVAALIALRRGRAALGVLFVAVMAWSLRQQLVGDDVTRAYFGTDTRAAEIAAGGILALGHDRVRAAAARWGGLPDVLGVVALAATLMLWWRVPDLEAVTGGGLVAVALVNAVLVHAAVDGRRIPSLLSARPLVWLGLVSYGVYLFHFPLFILLDGARVGVDGPALLAVRVAATLAMAVVSHRLLERPIRRAERLRGQRSTVAFVGGLAAVVAVSLVAPTVLERRDGGVGDGIDVAVGTPIVAVAGSPAPPHLVLVGDSTAASLGRGLEPWGQRSGRLRVTTVASQGCTTLPGVRARIREGYELTPKGCDVLFRAAADVAVEQDADAIVVMIGSSQLADWLYPGSSAWHDITERDVQDAYRRALEQALDELAASELPVLWADLPTPAWDLEAFGELLGGQLPGTGPVVLNDEGRAAIVAALDAEVVGAHPSAVVWPWTDVLTGPAGEIPEGLRFDGLHVDEARVDELAEGELLSTLEAAYDAVVERGGSGLRGPEHHAWSVSSSD